MKERQQLWRNIERALITFDEDGMRFVLVVALIRGMDAEELDKLLEHLAASKAVAEGVASVTTTFVAGCSHPAESRMQIVSGKIRTARMHVEQCGSCGATRSVFDEEHEWGPWKPKSPLEDGETTRTSGA